MGLIEVGDIIVAKDKRLFLVTEVTLPYRKNSFDDNTLNLTSRFFNLLKLKKLSNLLYLEINYKE